MIEFLELNDFLKNKNISYRKSIILKYYSTFKTGGMCQFFIEPNSYTDMVSLLKYLTEKDIEFRVLGFTTNICFIDDVEYSIIISTQNFKDIQIDHNTHRITVSAGFSLYEFVRLMLVEGYGHFEGLEGIPGSIGGAVYMNAGAYGYLISDHLESITVYDTYSGKIEHIKNEGIFGFRYSIFQNKRQLIILNARFKVSFTNKKLAVKKMETYHVARHKYQDFTYPTLGSTFATLDIYNDFIKVPDTYFILLKIIKKVFKNRFMRFLNHRKSNNNILNKLVMTFFPEINKDFISSKTINTLINNGYSFGEIINHLKFLRDNINPEKRIEIEFLTDVISDKGKDGEIYIKEINEILKVERK